MSIDTIRDAAEVVIDNVLATTEDQWLELRKEGIGGSDAAAAVGLSPWDSPYSLWAHKLGLTPRIDVNDAMRWGTRLEQAIGEGFAEDTGIPVVRYPVMLRSRQYPWAQVNLDFLTADAEAVVEVKNVGLYQLEEWEDGNVPAHYSIQGQHELAVTGLDHLWFAALVGGQNPRYIEMKRDQGLIDDLMEGERVFWEMVQSNTPPAADGTEATKRALAEQYSHAEPGSMTEVDKAVMGELVARRTALKADEKYTKAALMAVENQIKAILGDHEIGTIDGVPAVTWKTSHPKRIDPDMLRDLYPDVAEAVTTSKPERRLLVPKSSPFNK